MKIVTRTRYLITALLIASLTWALVTEYIIQAKPTLLYSQRASATFGGVSPTGDLVWVSQGRGSTIHAADDGTQVGSNRNVAHPATPLSFIDQERHLVAGQYHRAVFTLSGSCLSDHYGSHIAISPSKDRVFTGKRLDGNQVKLVMLGSTGGTDWDINIPGREIYSVDYHPKGHQVAVAIISSHGDHKVLVLNADDGKIVWSDERAQRPTEVAFSPDGKYLAAVWDQFSQNREIKLTETKRYKTSRVLVDGLRIWPNQGFRWNPDSKTMVVNVNFSDHKANVYLFRVKDGHQIAQLPGERIPFNLDYTKDGRAFLTVRQEKDGSEVTTIGTLRSAKDGKKIKELSLAGSTNVNMSPDGRVLFDAGLHKDTRSEVSLLVGKKKLSIPGNVHRSFIDPSGAKLVTTHGDHYKVWEL